MTKALFAQTAGYTGLIVLDNKINTNFNRIVYGNNNRAFFVRIPIVFVLKPDADVINKLPPGSYPVTLQNERTVKFSRPMWTKNILQNAKNSTKSLPDKIREQFKSLSFLSWITLGKYLVFFCQASGHWEFLTDEDFTFFILKSSQMMSGKWVNLRRSKDEK